MLSSPEALGIPLGVPSESLSLAFLQANGISDTMALTTPTSVVRILWDTCYLGNKVKILV